MMYTNAELEIGIRQLAAENKELQSRIAVLETALRVHIYDEMAHKW